MKFNKTFLTILQLFFVVAIYSQQKRVLEKPEKFKNPVDGMNLTIEGETISEPWVVYSDRDNNQTYTQPNANTPKNKIQFLERFYVVNKSGEWLNIFKGDVNDNGVLINAVDNGWINQKNLLLWTKCISKNEISRKAMILNTFEGLRSSDIVKGEAGTVKFFQNPKLTKQTDKITNLFEIFFVFKTSEDAYLLGKDERIFNTEEPNNSVYGWVSKSKVTPWDHRVALIPNTKEQAVRERQSKSIKAKIFIDKPSAEKYKNGTLSNESQVVIWDNDEFKSTYPGTYMRLPVLSTQKDIEENKGVFKVVSLGEITSKRNRSISALKYSETTQEYNDNRAKLRKINIIFVIDGTKSMTQYFKPVSDAVRISMNELDKSKNDFKFGVVVYRDATEGLRKVEIFKPSSNIPEVTNFLKNISTVESGKDKDLREAVFFGLMNAARGMALSKEETNLIILVGDCGNHIRNDETFVTKEDLISSLSDKNTHFLAFQVSNKGSLDYTSFVSQSKEIINGIQNRLFDKSKNIATKTGNTPELPTLKLVNVKTWNVDNPMTLGRVVFSLPNDSFTPNQLKNEIIISVNEVNKFTNNLLDLSNDIVSHGQSLKKVSGVNADIFSKQGEAKSQYVSSYSNALLLLFANMENMTDEKLDILCDERYQLSYNGYSNLTSARTEYPLFQPVLFMTSFDLVNMLKIMNDLADASKNAERRKKLKETWLELLKKHIGNVSNSELDNYTMEQINMKVFGLPQTSDLLKNLKLKDIEDKSIFPDDKLQRWIDNVNRKIKKLNNIMNTNDETYSFLTNDWRYFWIDQDFLP